ncbi:MAG: YebC/PmpR family DNA-binding transcriptional regulator [Candidatus Colwellbacteria bacterium]|nr:YebC/PmpR family DNA-binding transcriptional regulator [Candidatus Colwellbacteria bacterium]
MSGHNKWSQIKHKKAITDQKKAKVFTKLLAAVQASAREEVNPDFNPRLRTAIQKAKEANIPQENIERAINRAKDNPTEEMLIEAYGPGGTAFLIAVITDSRNRAIAEIKKLLSDNNAKFAEQGSVQWMFNQSLEGEWTPKFEQSINDELAPEIESLMEALDDHQDVVEIYTNADIKSKEEVDIEE